MRIARLARLLPAVAVALMATGAWAWNDTGHKTIALIAWDDLTPTVRGKITALLQKHPQYATLIQTKGTTDDESHLLDMMTAATWPDLIRTPKPENRQYQHSPWHYTDFPYITGTLPPNKQHPAALSEDWKAGDLPDNILPALKQCEAEIADPKSTDEQKAIALAWILHLTGDIHQPLHATSWFSEEFPDGDKGGNSVFVNTGGTAINLHAYWDGLLGKYVSLDATRTVAAEIKKDHPRSEFAEQLKDTVFKDWALESFEVCKTTVYMNGKIPHGLAAKDVAPPLTKAYQDDALALGRKRIALAGYRLADQLNRLFADK